jgi:hypothetical protein
MSRQQYVKVGICNKYQTLLEECERAWSSWKERRGETSQSRSVGKEAGDELVCLQAKYARAYTFLQNHAPNCSLCQLVARIDGRDSKNNDVATSPVGMVARRRLGRLHQQEAQ